MSKCMEGRKGIASFYLNGGFRRPGNHGGGCGVGGDDGGGERDDHDGGGAAAIQSPDGSHMALALIPVAPAPAPAPVGVATLDQTTSVPEKKRGRPYGSGRKQKLANVGEWMRNSAGSAFTPHIIHVSAGEEVAEKILSFAQQKKRALCVLSATGSVSNVTLRQFTASGGTVTYNDRFDILTMTGAYLPAVTGGPRNRAGGVSISVRNDDGRVIGIAVGGKVIASTLVQVVVASFVYGGGDGSK